MVAGAEVGPWHRTHQTQAELVVSLASSQEVRGGQVVAGEALVGEPEAGALNKVGGPTHPSLVAVVVAA